MTIWVTFFRLLRRSVLDALQKKRGGTRVIGDTRYTCLWILAGLAIGLGANKSTAEPIPADAFEIAAGTPLDVDAHLDGGIWLTDEAGTTLRVNNRALLRVPQNRWVDLYTFHDTNGALVDPGRDTARRFAAGFERAQSSGYMGTDPMFVDQLDTYARQGRRLLRGSRMIQYGGVAQALLVRGAGIGVALLSGAPNVLRNMPSYVAGEAFYLYVQAPNVFIHQFALTNLKDRADQLAWQAAWARDRVQQRRGLSAERPLVLSDVAKAYRSAVAIDSLLLPLAELVIAAQMDPSWSAQWDRSAQALGTTTASLTIGTVPLAVGGGVLSVSNMMEDAEIRVPAFGAFAETARKRSEIWTNSRAGDGQSLPRRAIHWVVAARQAAPEAPSAQALPASSGGNPNLCREWYSPDKRLRLLMPLGEKELREHTEMWARATAADIARCAGEWTDETRDPDGFTPLHYVAATGRSELVQSLLDLGIELEARSKSGRRALHIAAHFNQPDAIEALASQGATYPPAEGYLPTPLSVAARQGSGDAIRVLAPLHRAAIETALPPTLLVRAISARSPDAVRALTEAGMDPNGSLEGAELPRGITTFLKLAVNSKNPEVVKALIEAGADVAAANGSGQTALHAAVGRGEISIAEVLLDAGADANARTNSGGTPMHFIGRVRGRIGLREDGLLRLAANLEAYGGSPSALDDKCQTPFDVIGRKTIAALKGKLYRYLLSGHRARDKACVPREVGRTLGTLSGHATDATRRQQTVDTRPAKVDANEARIVDEDFSGNSGLTWQPRLATSGTKGRLALDGMFHVVRKGAGGSGSAIKIERELDQEIAGPVVVSFDAAPIVRTVRHGCGDRCYEHPITVCLLVEDRAGIRHHVLYGVNYGSAARRNDRTNRKGEVFYGRPVSVPQGEMTTVRHVLQDTVPDAARLVGLTVMGSGWDFEGKLDNLRVTVTGE